MKKQLIIALAISTLAVLAFTSCSKEEVVVENVDYIIGKWQRSTEYYRYDADGFGRTWDTADDVTEDEAQEFTWTLEQDKNEAGEPYILTHIHIMEMGAEVPKVYEVTKLTATSLVYVDDYGNEYSFVKVD